MFRALFVIAVAVLCLSGCRPWQQAEQVLHTADSLDAQGVIYRDTAAFRSVIRTYDRPVVRCLKHSDLGKAYYYLGRNYEDYHQRYLSAAKCYTRSDQCHISDPIMRGRVNSCMAYMCAQRNVDSLALCFYQRAYTHFALANDSMYIKHTLVNLSDTYTKLKHWETADSIYQSITNITDSLLLERCLHSRAFYFYNQQQYDSALVYYKRCLPFPHNSSDEVLLRHRLMQVFYHTNRLDSAVVYAQDLVKTSKNLTVCTNAYYILIEDATNKNDAQAVADYAHLRADINNMRTEEREDRSLAIYVLNGYVYSKSPIHKQMIVSLLLTSGIMLCLYLWRLYKRNTRNKQKSLCEIKEESPTLTQEVRTMETVEEHINLFATDMATHAIWNDYATLYDKANLFLFDIVSHLQDSYRLSQQDVKICLMSLLQMSRKDMAKNLYRAESSIPKLRAKTAKLLGTDSTNLRNFLLDYLTKNI